MRLAETPQLEGEQLAVQGEPSKPGIKEREQNTPGILKVIHGIAKATEKTSYLLLTNLTEQGQQDIGSVRKSIGTFQGWHATDS